MLLEQMIQTECLTDFIIRLYERHDEDKMWEYYLHTCARSMSFDEFRRRPPSEPEHIERERMVEIVKNSMDILSRQSKTDRKG